MPKKVTKTKKSAKKPETKKAHVVKKVNPKLLPEVNIGALGHVDHGKSTLVEAIAGKWPAMHSEELKRGITIRLGYADATIYKCDKCGKLMTLDKCLSCMSGCSPVRTISFVDAPGHETLMATVLAGASLMDGAILVIAANEPCPQPQTQEHLMTLNIAGIKNIIIVQTKIDLVPKEKVLENYAQIKKFLKGSIAENAPIIPVASQKKVNIDALLQAIEEKIPTPDRDQGDPKMFVVRSFDVNKPGTSIEKLMGGVIGGSLVRGTFKQGDEVEIRPGVKKGNRWVPLITKITGLKKSKYILKESGPGGLLGLMTDLDPSLSKSDMLGGNVVGLKGKLPESCLTVKLKPTLFENLVGKGGKIMPIKDGELIMINIGTSRTVGIAKKSKKLYEFALKLPAVCEAGENAVLSRLMADRWRLIGYGKVE
jgi:translation initiation factor 2 subunit 3